MLIKDSKVVLEYLKPKYKLHIITNGFDDVQYLKLQFAGIHSFFENIITSDLAKSKKPNPDIFSFSLKQVNAIKEDCLMIGDDIIADCVGSKEFGIDQVYFNPDNISHNYNFTHEISNLIQLKEIL
jgi:putative hydrolase of the HAD superfamily